MKLMTLTLLAMLSVPYTSVAANKCLTAVESFKWPAEGKPADMDKLSKFSKKILSLGKLKKKKVETGSVKWTGPDKINHLYVGQHDIAERFSLSSLDYHQERGRNPIDVTIWTFMNLGMDQGVGALMKSDSWLSLSMNSYHLQTAKNATQAKGFVKRILDEWKNIEDGTAFKTNKNPLEGELVRASTEMITSYYQTGSSPEAIQKALQDLALISYEQGRRVWLDIDGGSMLRSQIRFLKFYAEQLDKTPQAEMDSMLSSLKAEAAQLMTTLLKLQKNK
jgi:hypothetical protein